MASQEEEVINQLEERGYNLVNRTSSRLFLHFKKELGIPGEVMDIVKKIGFMYSCLPIDERPGYYQLIVSKTKEDRFE